MKKTILISGLLLLLATAACVVAPGPGYYPGPYVVHPVVYGGGYYYHHGYGYYR
jgi:hypothetical protein